LVTTFEQSSAFFSVSENISSGREATEVLGEGNELRSRGGVYFKAFGGSCYSGSPFLPTQRGQPGEVTKLVERTAF
jgi:hypothetical protein